MMRIVGIIALLATCFFVALGSWMLATPVGSAPDDGIHLPSIYCASSAPASLCRESLGFTPTDVPVREYLVPAQIANGRYCFKSRHIAASCQKLTYTGASVAEAPDLLNKTGLYPPGFYWFMGHFAGTNINASVYLMRLITVIFAVVAVVGGLALAPPRIRQAGGIGFIVAMGPLGWFLMTTTNPSSWSIIGVGMYWVLLLTHIETDVPWRRWTAFGGAVLLAIIACSARADSGAFLMILSAATATLMVRRGIARVRLYSAAALVAVIAAISGYILLSTSQVSSAAQGALAGTASGFGVLVYNVIDIPQLIFASFGYIPYDIWQLSPPLAVPILATLLVGMLFTIGLSRDCPRRTLLAWGLVAAAIVVIPITILNSGHSYVGQTEPWNALVEPRYLLPLLPALIGLPFVRPGATSTLRFTRIQRWAWALICWFVFTVSLYVVIANFTRAKAPGPNGLASPSRWFPDTLGAINLTSGSRWRAFGAISPMELWIAGTVAAGLGLYVAMRYLLPRDSADPGAEETGDLEEEATRVIGTELSADPLLSMSP